jgi:hypothetical protein
MKFYSKVSLALCFLYSFSQTAHAYIDPETGSYSTQFLIAGLVVIAYVVKVYWKQIKSFYKKIFKKNK